MNAPPSLGRWLSEDEPLPDERASARDWNLRIIRNCLIVLAAIATLTGGVAAGALIAPTVVAVILAIVLAPPARVLERIGIPTGVAAVLIVGVVVAGFAAGVVALAPSVSEWTQRAPEIVRTVEHKLRPIKKQLAVVENASRQIEQVGASQPSRAAPVAAPAGEDGMLAFLATSASRAIAKLIYITVLTIFLLALRKHYTAQLILLPKQHVNRIRMARICRDVRNRVAGYLLTLATINVGLAVATGICFTVAGIADPLFWAVAYGILNFVPVIGSTTIIVVALAYGLATAQTLTGAILPAAILLTLDTIQAYGAQPLLLARRLVISPIAIFVMVATLVWMWGAPAAITAVPVLILMHTVMMHVPALKPLATLLATASASRRN